MAEKVFQEKVVSLFINPFCRVPVKYNGVDLGNPIAKRVASVQVDKETLMVVPVVEDVDTDQEINACRDLCGFELLRHQLATGQATLADFGDDGQHGVDNTVLPATVHDAARINADLNATIAKLCAMLGVEDGKALTADMVETLINQKLVKTDNAGVQSTPQEAQQ